MKILRNSLAFAALLILFAATSAQAQKSDEATIKRLVSSKNFVFVAQTVIPTGGPSRNITSDYDMRVSSDSIVTYLPYFGRAYTPILPNETGINFTSSQFSYAAEPARKGGWDISIEPKDTRDVRQLNISVSRNGYATLQVTSNNKQAISYYGYLKEK